MLCISVFTFGFAATIMGIIGIIEGIVYLTRSDDEFVTTYITNKKRWF